MSNIVKNAALLSAFVIGSFSACMGQQNKEKTSLPEAKVNNTRSVLPSASKAAAFVNDTAFVREQEEKGFKINNRVVGQLSSGDSAISYEMEIDTKGYHQKWHTVLAHKKDQPYPDFTKDDRFYQYVEAENGKTGDKFTLVLNATGRTGTVLATRLGDRQGQIIVPDEIVEHINNDIVNNPEGAHDFLKNVVKKGAPVNKMITGYTVVDNTAVINPLINVLNVNDLSIGARTSFDMTKTNK